MSYLAGPSLLAPPAFKECLLSSSIFPDGGKSASLPFPVTDSTHFPWLLASSLHLHAMKHLFGLHCNLHLVLTTTRRGSSPLNIQIIWNNLSFSRYTPIFFFFFLLCKITYSCISGDSVQFSSVAQSCLTL